MENTKKEEYSCAENGINDKELVFLNVKNLVKKVHEQGGSWNDVVYLFQKREKLIDDAISLGKMPFYVVNVSSTPYQQELLKDIRFFDTPLVDALQNDDMQLLDCILERYPESVTQTPNALQLVTHSEEGLSKIADCCQKNGFTDYLKEHTDDMVFAFQELSRCHVLRSDDTYCKNALKFVELCESVSGGKDNELCAQFLTYAVQNTQPALCEALLKKGYNPLSFCDNSCTTTNYEAAYEKLLRYPKSKICSQVMDAMRASIPADKKAYAEEFEKFIAKKYKGQKEANRVIVVGSVMMMAIVGLMISECDKAIDYFSGKDRQEQKVQPNQPSKEATDSKEDQSEPSSKQPAVPEKVSASLRVKSVSPHVHER